MNLEELLGTLPADWHVRKDGDALVLEGPPRNRWPKAVAADYASNRLRERTVRRIKRTADLTHEGRTAREIGEILGAEEDQPAFPVTTVRTWRHRARQEGLLPPL